MHLLVSGGDKPERVTILQLSPKLPDCVVPAPPDFVGIGAQRCGTTWWHGIMTWHPKIYASQHLVGKVQPPYLVKERHFFDRFFASAMQPDDIRDIRQCLAGYIPPI
ncbi:MAG TPA: hypothetical protein DDW52_02405 [Planctomycetaceae bacterium]|nr:hypothetical protein [Planctomycetaceae bacterium]